MEERKELTLQGGGQQIEIDGGRDREIKRNTLLGGTEEGVRGMRGLQAQEPHMGKNNSSMSFSIYLPFSPSPLLSFSHCKPLLVGEEINSRLVCLRLQEFVVVVECVYLCASVSVFFFFLFFCCGRQDENFRGLSNTQGRQKIASLPPYFPTLSYPSFTPFFLPICVTSILPSRSLSPSSHPSALYLFLYLCFFSSLSVLLFPLLQGGL